MSWDVLLMRLPGQARAVDELPRDYVPPALGGRDRMLASHTDPAACAAALIEAARRADQAAATEGREAVDDNATAVVVYVQDTADQQQRRLPLDCPEPT